MYGQVTQLFNTAPDLLEDFKQFLPESAAQAKAQAAAARQAMEDATAVSNVRGEPGYSNAALAQTPRSDVKMPPLGQFSVKDSAKDSKKRRGGGPGAQSAGAGVSGQPGGTDSMSAGGSQGRGGGLQTGGLHKVSQVLISLFLCVVAGQHTSRIPIHQSNTSIFLLWHFVFIYNTTEHPVESLPFLIFLSHNLFHFHPTPSPPKFLFPFSSNT